MIQIRCRYLEFICKTSACEYEWLQGLNEDCLIMILIKSALSMTVLSVFGTL